MPYVYETKYVEFCKKFPHSAAWYFQKSYFASKLSTFQQLWKVSRYTCNQFGLDGKCKFACCPEEKVFAQLGTLVIVHWVSALID